VLHRLSKSVYDSLCDYGARYQRKSWLAAQHTLQIQKASIIFPLTSKYSSLRHPSSLPTHPLDNDRKHHISACSALPCVVDSGRYETSAAPTPNRAQRPQSTVSAWTDTNLIFWKEGLSLVFEVVPWRSETRMSGNAMISCKFAMQSQVGLQSTPYLITVHCVVRSLARCDCPAIYGGLRL